MEEAEAIAQGLSHLHTDSSNLPFLVNDLRLTGYNRRCLRHNLESQESQAVRQESRGLCIRTEAARIRDKVFRLTVGGIAEMLDQCAPLGARTFGRERCDRCA
jgi:hypothetical protein